AREVELEAAAVPKEVAAVAEVAAVVEVAAVASPSRSRFEEPPAGWTRYQDPESERTYLYCEADGSWHWEEQPEVQLQKEVAAAGTSCPTGTASSEWPSPTLAGGSTSSTAIGQRSRKAGPDGLSSVPPVSEDLHAPRPPAPAVPQEPQGGSSSASSAPAAEPVVAEATLGGGREEGLREFISERPEVIELAKRDQIVAHLVRDEMKLRKKLREIEALEASSATGTSLEAMQVAKVSKKGAILSDLQIIREQIEEALRDFAASPHASVPCAGTARPAAALAPKKAVASSGKSKVAAVDPLPQRGKAPMPVNPRIVIEDGNSASRLAAYAPSSTVARSSMGYATVDEVQTRPLAAAAPLAARASAPLAARASARPKGGAGSVQALPPQSEQMAAVHETGRLLRLGPLHVGSSRPPPPPVPSRGQSAVAFSGEARRLPEEDDQSDGGFVQVKRGAKVGKKKGPVASGGGQDDDDAFW
ncbi:unnamed protein product, partial [Polarella glacialis]